MKEALFNIGAGIWELCKVVGAVAGIFVFFGVIMSPLMLALNYHGAWILLYTPVVLFIFWVWGEEARSDRRRRIG